MKQPDVPSTWTLATLACFVACLRGRAEDAKNKNMTLGLADENKSGRGIHRSLVTIGRGFS